MIKLKRIEPGLYRSADGQVTVRRVVSRQTYRADEVLWMASIDGTNFMREYDTKNEAVRAVSAKLLEMEIAEADEGATQ